MNYKVCFNSKLKISVFLILLLTVFSSFTLPAASQKYSIINYTEKSGDIYSYKTEQLDSNYTQDWENVLCNNGEDWSMESYIYNVEENDLGEIQIQGSSKLINTSVISGFTGGSFVNVKGQSGEEIYLGSTKSGLPLGTIDVDEDIAGQVGWGVNTAKAEIYVSGYKIQKIAWWKVKIPILKIRIIPYTRTIAWQFNVPVYVSNKEICIEIINTHTPTRRVIKTIEKAGDTVYSFALQCGLPTALLSIKIYRGSFDYSDFESYICCVLSWAANEKLLDSGKSQNVRNILHAIGDLIDNYKDGLNLQEQLDIVTMGFDLVTMISNKNFNVQSLTSFISSLETLVTGSDGNIISGTFDQVEIILENLKPLLKLSDEQAEIYDSILNTVAFINNIGSDTNSKIYTALNGFELIFDIYEQVKYGNITVENAETLINQWLDKVGIIISGTAPQYYDEFTAYRKTASILLVKILTVAYNQNWL